MKVIDAQVAQGSQYKKEGIVRHVPLIGAVTVRTFIGFSLLISSSLLAGMAIERGNIANLVVFNTIAWGVAVFLTDKYVHKYPQRYYTYLAASHLKAAMIMATVLWILSAVFELPAVSANVLWTSAIAFALLDALVSVPRAKDSTERNTPALEKLPKAEGAIEGRVTYGTPQVSSIKSQEILDKIRSTVDSPLYEFVEVNLPSCQEGMGDAIVIDDITAADIVARHPQVGLLIGRTRVNDIRRLNQFLTYCVNSLAIGGYLVVRYTPLDNVQRSLRRRYSGPRYWLALIGHFIWYRALPKTPWLDQLYFTSRLAWLDKHYLSLAGRRNRVLSKAEMWGRLAYFGMDVIAESRGDNERYLIARRITFPVQSKRPSYYPIVALEKVGLDGKTTRMHKIRTMFPFSEFLQKRIFEDHGLTSTGKFKDDFRLTGVGKCLRRYWLDEVPQIFDWLRGEVKLVGMRATSRHFLSLYPKEFHDLYIQIKPGLIPPIYKETTGGFDEIVNVELMYLRRYINDPFRTDVRYLFMTLTDIIFKGVRSK